MRYFTIAPLDAVDHSKVGEGLAATFSTISWWRLVTPAFLHFGIIHLVFNALWTWETGKRLETYLGSLKFLMLIVTIAVAANVIQYGWTGSIWFGGLSGLVYGLFGFIWICNKYQPNALLSLPEGIYVFMIVWLIAGAVGLLDFVLPVVVANAAHVGGLLTGLALALLYTRVFFPRKR